MTPVFQPIVSVNQRQIVGYEALIRSPSDSPLHSPSNLFDTAERHDLQTALEFVCREIAIRRFARMNIPGKRFNKCQSVDIARHRLQIRRNLEIYRGFRLGSACDHHRTDKTSTTDDYGIVRQAVEHYRCMGFEIALDDLGAGYSGLRVWAELKPEYVKIDKHFARVCTMNFFPLLSLSMGLLDAQTTRLCQSHLDFSDLACEAKKQAKKRPGNTYFINPLRHDKQVAEESISI